jgi:hypothetical protein
LARLFWNPGLVTAARTASTDSQTATLMNVVLPTCERDAIVEFAELHQPISTCPFSSPMRRAGAAERADRPAFRLLRGNPFGGSARRQPDRRRRAET